MYNFDEIIDRRNTNAMNTDGFLDYIFHEDEAVIFRKRCGIEFSRQSRWL